MVTKIRAVLKDGQSSSCELDVVQDLVGHAPVARVDKKRVLSRLEKWREPDDALSA